jgi:multidrug transporter EmrE-like cation transporter
VSAKKILGIILLAAGLLALAYGGFTYTKDGHDAQIGPIELSVQEKERVNIPMWAGVAAVVAGVALLVVGRK